MKCPMCDGMGTSNVCVNGTFKTCAYCNGKGEVENLCDTCGTICPFEDEHSECEVYSPQTNEGWFTSLSTEEKAKVLFDIWYDGKVLAWDKSKPFYFNRFVTWLKEVHKDEV